MAITTHVSASRRRPEQYRRGRHRRPRHDLNPFAGGTEEELSHLLRAMCSEGLDAADLAELEDQIEAVVPAAVELRDAGHLVLTARAIADAGKLEGIMELAEDTRLSDLSRNRCRALRDRYIIQGVKALPGHL